MSLSLADVQHVALHVRRNHEQRLRLASDVQALALPDREEMRPAMPSDARSVRLAVRVRRSQLIERRAVGQRTVYRAPVDLDVLAATVVTRSHVIGPQVERRFQEGVELDFAGLQSTSGFGVRPRPYSANI